MNNWIRARLHKLIKEEINAGKRIIVCPYGEWGMVLADILEKAYGIKDTIILDNGLSKYNSEIHPVEELKEWNTEDMTIILTSISIKNSKEIERQIKELGINISIKNILQPEIQESPQKESYFQDLKKILYCKKVRKKILMRVGGDEGDGGYIMVDDFDNTIRAYSFGIGNNVSWDMDIANKGMKVFLYDHTIDHLPRVHNNFTFYKLGVGKGNNCLPLEEILNDNGDLDNHNLIMKMDVEGTEWDVLDNIPISLLSNFKQISLELHGVCKCECQEKILKILQKISVTHQAIWVHGNNADKAEVANGILIPNLIEVTYVRRDSYSFDDGACKFPIPLDLPNLMYRHDFDMGNWGE